MISVIMIVWFSMLVFLFAGEVESTVLNVSGGNNTGNDVGNEQPHSMPVNRVGELSVSQPGVIPESEGQKVCLVYNVGFLWK